MRTMNIKNIGTITTTHSDGTVTRIVSDENTHISMTNGTIYINGKKLEKTNTKKETKEDIYERAFKNPCATRTQSKQDIIDAQAKEIAELQKRLDAAKRIIADHVSTIAEQRDKIALLEAKMNANSASDNNDRLVIPNKFNYTVKDAIARTMAYEEIQKASCRIIKSTIR